MWQFCGMLKNRVIMLTAEAKPANKTYKMHRKLAKYVGMKHKEERL
jgi:hypothetical protein